jgi:Phage terminase large subunit (GpA)
MKDKNYYSILQWIVGENIVNEKGEALDFYDHPFLLDVLTDWNPKIVVKACAQVGKSVTFTLKTLFAIKYLRFNVIYTFPTDDDVKEFVSSKVNKILQANKHEFSGMDTDSIERKEINDRFIFFKGTVSKTAAISNSADLVVHDEASRSNQQALDTYKSRTKASEFKGRWLFSNPTTEKDILDQEWQKSNQMEWTITCPHCTSEHHMAWPESINIPKKCFQCRVCKEPISDDVRRKGKWVAQNPDSDISGYHMSHLIATRISAKEIIDDSEGDQEYFYNFVLGEPYNPGDLAVSRSTILDIWTPRDIKTGNYYIGIDVGNIKHYTLWSDKGVVKVGKFTKWQDLDDILLFYKPVSGVIDAMPDNTMSKYYVETYPFMQMSFFQENSSNPQTHVWWGENDKKGIVYSHRDRIIDKMLTDMVEAKFLLGMETNKDFLEYIKHFETLRRMKVTNNAGIERYVWESTTGVDHYVFATLYGYLARMGAGAGVFYGEVTEENKPSVLGADNVYDITNAFLENNSNNE